MDYKTMRDRIEDMVNDNHKDFVKAVISMEKGVNDESALDKLYDAYMDNDTVNLLHEEFDYMIEDLREQGQIKDLPYVQEEQDNLINIVGNIVGKVDVIERESKNGEAFKVANFSVVSKNDEGDKVYHNCSAYGEKSDIPKHYVGSELVEINEFSDFKEGTRPFTVFDVIESFNRHTTKSSQFRNEINAIFKLNNINVELRNGEVHSTSNKAIGLDDSTNINEAGLEELIRTAEVSYNKGEYSYAVEKIWDAFERIKTYYPTLDKKKSAEKIINDISYGNEHIKKMFDNEFKVLTDTGNSYRIRHHEINKIDISKELHYKYFYKRCLALISVIVENLQ